MEAGGFLGLLLLSKYRYTEEYFKPNDDSIEWHPLQDNQPQGHRRKIENYSAALIRQFKTEKSKQRFNMEDRKLLNDYQIEELEEEAKSEARYTSPILTTAEAKSHRKNMQHRLDQLFNEDETDEDTYNTGLLDLASHSEGEEGPFSNEEVEAADLQASQSVTSTLIRLLTDRLVAGSATNASNVEIDNPFTQEEEEQFPTLKASKD